MITRLEDLLVWQKSRVFCQEVYKLVKKFPALERNNLTSQLIRAANSICANIAEGYGRHNPQETIQFYRIARGSLIEVKSHLYIASDQIYINEEEFKEILIKSDEIGRMLNAFISTTKTIRK